MPFKQRKKTTWICRQPISTLLSLAKAHEFCHQSSGLAVLKKRLLVWPRFQFLRKHFLPLFLLEITSLGKTCWIDSFLRAISFYAGNSIFSVVCCCCSTKNYSSRGGAQKNRLHTYPWWGDLSFEKEREKTLTYFILSKKRLSKYRILTKYGSCFPKDYPVFYIYSTV